MVTVKLILARCVIKNVRLAMDKVQVVKNAIQDTLTMDLIVFNAHRTVLFVQILLIAKYVLRVLSK